MKHVPVMRAAVVIMVMMMAGPALAQQPQQQYFALGIGNSSCAFWQSDPRRMNEGIAYLQGVYTGINIRTGAFVGKGSDLEGVVAEVKRACSDRPSLAFIDAIAEAYVRMAKTSP